jgi:hypothetical protein
MIDYFMKNASPHSGYYLYNHQELAEKLLETQENKQKTLLWGVTFALLDFIEHFPIAYPDLTVMETGGMKGRKKEMPREEVHQKLCNAFGVSSIHSEYGMTECTSQAYSFGQGILETPPQMKVLTREVNDPFTVSEGPSRGALNIIDLGNIDACAFIATDDLGIVHKDQRFEVIGRMDNSDMRGCSLLTV